MMKLCVLIAVISAFGLARGMDYKASCMIKDDSGIPAQKIKGTILFTQPEAGGDVTMDVALTGFAAPDGSHGFHVHQNADLGNQCKNAGGHYNPENNVHAGPKDAIRHVGDLGNVEEKNGAVTTKFTDNVISLRAADGNKNIIGKSIVVHADSDDLGRGGFPDSNTTGHAGARLGCCVITDTTNSALPVAVSLAALILSILVSLFQL